VEIYSLPLQWTSVAPANGIRSWMIFSTLMMEAIFSSDTSVRTKATLSKIPEDDILHSHCRENLKSYIALTGWAL
jgi:hypothetical protein